MDRGSSSGINKNLKHSIKSETDTSDSIPGSSGEVTNAPMPNNRPSAPTQEFMLDDLSHNDQPVIFIKSR